MNSRNIFTGLLSVALGIAALGTTAQAQLTMELPIYIADNGDGPQPGLDTLYLGFKPGATNGLDGEIGEDQQPPAPPEGVFDARWVNVGSSSNLGQGTKRNYHAYSSSTQKDTFRLKLQPSFTEGKNGYPITLTWPALGSYFTAASLRFVDGDGNPQVHDMMTSTSFSFSNAASVTSTVTIATEGPKDPSNSVDMEHAVAALELVNAPNPATSQRGTTISYTLPRTSHVTIRLYNGLGELVKTVLNERQEMARHSVPVSTMEMPAGNYFYTIEAAGFIATRSFVVVDY